LLGLALVGCTQPRATAAPKPSPKPLIEEMMIAFTKKVARILCVHPLTVTDAAKQIGTVVRDYGGNLQIVVRPSEAAFSQADVVRRPGTEEPNSVDLVPAEADALPVATLKAAFGAYHKLPQIHYDSPTKIGFGEIDRAGPTLSCTLYAQVKPGAHGIDDGTVAQLTILRDRL
jgi:hypothetical protein